MSQRNGERRGACAAFLAVLLALGGCALPPPSTVPATVLGGRLAVRVDSDPPRSFAAEFELRGDARVGSLRLIGPLGLTAAEARWSPAGASLLTGDGVQAYPDTESLGAAALGERVPLAALLDWLRGRAWPQAPSEAVPSGFAQLGWRVDLSRAAEGRIEARREAAPAVTVRAQVERES